LDSLKAWTNIFEPFVGGLRIMKTLLQICVFGCMLILIAGAYGWEFNDDGNLEGWTRSRSTIEVKDGYMVVGVTANIAWARAVSPLGPYDGNEVTGLYAKMVASQARNKAATVNSLNWQAIPISPKSSMWTWPRMRIGPATKSTSSRLTFLTGRRRTTR
jgi:hypothetical protein